MPSGVTSSNSAWVHSLFLLIFALLVSCASNRRDSDPVLPPSLLDFAYAKPLGLPQPTITGERLENFAAVELGRRLFSDVRLSEEQAVACSSCHSPKHGFSRSDYPNPLPPGASPQRRNIPSLLNVAYYDRLFVDGREDKLEHQLWTHLLDGFPMGHVSVGSFVQRVNSITEYRAPFKLSFGDAPNAGSIAYALASFQRTLIAGDAPFDRWFFGGDEHAVKDDVKRGFKLFRGKAKCAACHTVSQDAALFSDQEFHNTGIGYQASLQGPFYQVMTIEPGVEVQVAPAYGADYRFRDMGRFAVTGTAGDQWKYRTPNLRNVAQTPPYMHNGSVPSLADVIDFYDRGGVTHDLLDSKIGPLDLSPEDKSDLVAFLRSLTSDNLQEIVRLSLDGNNSDF